MQTFADVQHEQEPAAEHPLREPHFEEKAARQTSGRGVKNAKQMFFSSQFLTAARRHRCH